LFSFLFAKEMYGNPKKMSRKRKNLQIRLEIFHKLEYNTSVVDKAASWKTTSSMTLPQICGLKLRKIGFIRAAFCE